MLQRTIRTVSHRVGAGLGAAGITLGLASCALLTGPVPETPEREIPAVPESTPELIPDGTAAENLPYFTEVIRGYAAGEAPIEGEPVVNAVADAGFERTQMQVSFDRSETNLVADNIFVSVRIGTDCLIGQLVVEGREFVSRVEPALGPDRSICLLGETRIIDW